MMLGDVVPGADPVRFSDLYSSPFVLDPTRRAVLVWDRWHRITQEFGNVYVSVETDDREHPATVRSRALRFVREHLGSEWHISAYVGRENYRNVAGFPAWARRYSVVRVGGAQ